MKRALIIMLVVVCAFMTACSQPVSTPSPGATDTTDATETPQNSAAGEKIKIVTWHTLADHHEAAFQEIIDDFNASQDKYEVVAEQQTYGEYNAKLMQAVSNGAAPDFVSMFPSDAANYIKEGYVYDMSAFINDPEIGMPNFESNLSPGVVKGITQWGGDQMYMIPDGITGEVLFYNKTMLDELGLPVPTTWTEIEATAEAIYEKYGIPGFGTDSIIDTYQCLISQAGSDYIDTASKSMAVDKQIGIDKLNWLANGIKEGYFRLVGEDQYFSNPFGSQAVGMYIGSSAGIDYVKAAIPTEGDGSFEFGCAPIPQEGPVKYISNWSYGDICLSQDEEHARGVYEFLKYYTTTDVAVKWAQAFGSSPVFKDAVEDPGFEEYAQTNEAVKALSEELQYAGFLPSIAGTETVRTEIDKMVQSVAAGQSDADTAFDTFISASNAALNQ